MGLGLRLGLGDQDMQARGSGLTSSIDLQGNVEILLEPQIKPDLSTHWLAGRLLPVGRRDGLDLDLHQPQQ